MKKHTKPLALIMAAVMLMGAMILPASAAVSGSVIGSTVVLDKEDVIKNAFSAYIGVEGEMVDYDSWTITWPNGTVHVFDPETFTWTRTEADGTVSTSQAVKPSYWYEDGKLIETATNKVVDEIPGKEAASTPAESEKFTGYVTGNIKTSATYFTKEAAIKSAISAVVGMEGDIVDWENYTVTRTWTGETCIWVFDPDAFTWTITNVDTGEVSINQAQKPKYWYIDHILIDTATGEPANGEAGNGHFYVNGVIADQTDPEPAESEKPEQRFHDVAPDAWYAEAVNAMAASGIINGDPDGSFRPEDNVTVGELCAIIYHIGKNDNPVNRPVPDHPEYTHWASYAVWTLRNARKSYTSSYPTFAEDAANRGEAIRAIIALIDDAGLMDNGTFTKIHDYTGPEIPDWDVIQKNSSDYYHRWGDTHILDAYNYGIINGVDAAGTCNPNGTLTRAELCQMLYNAGLTQYTPAEMKDRNSGLGFVLGG